MRFDSFDFETFSFFLEGWFDGVVYRTGWTMQFYVSDSLNNSTPGIHLCKSDWDDWFLFSTTYIAEYVDESHKAHRLGSMKIGECGLAGSKKPCERERTPGLPLEFVQLADRFFSLGQDDEYYENLKCLDEEFEQFSREAYLEAVRDMAFNLTIFEHYRNEPVVETSLLRSVSQVTVRGQFHRIAHGGARLSKYAFGYRLPSDSEEGASFTVNVTPEELPSTNVHAIIGRNGVGKTHLIVNLIKSIFFPLSSSGASEEEELGDETSLDSPHVSGWFFDLSTHKQIDAGRMFSNVICVGFSAFDNIPTKLEGGERAIGSQIPYVFVGLDNDTSPNVDKFQESDSNSFAEMRIRMIADKFMCNMEDVLRSSSKKDLWMSAMDCLSYDVHFKQSGIAGEVEEYSKGFTARDDLRNVFGRLSSGHKIALLTVTCLVNEVVEKSLVIMDEPETHLHPPLLAALVNAISKVLIRKNGVAILATHSPVVLQEIPASCVWKMFRSGHEVSLERVQLETYGADINSLMREVFGLELEQSGFHKLVKEQLRLNGNDYAATLEALQGGLGSEGRALMRILAACSACDKELAGNE